MATKEDITKMRETQDKLTEEDKKFSLQLTNMDDEFTAKNHVTKEDFNAAYSEGVKNFRLDFGTVCERGEAEVSSVSYIWECKPVIWSL